MRGHRFRRFSARDAEVLYFAGADALRMRGGRPGVLVVGRCWQGGNRLAGNGTHQARQVIRRMMGRLRMYAAGVVAALTGDFSRRRRRRRTGDWVGLRMGGFQKGGT